MTSNATPARIAAEHPRNTGHDYSIAFELAEYEAEQEAEDEERAERQRVNLRMAEWYGVDY